MRTVHERRIPVGADEVGRLLADVGGPEDRLWPATDWMPMRLDQPLQVGSRGGHADIHYEVTHYEPGRRIELAFVPPNGFPGWHAFEVEPLPDGDTLVRHVLVAEPRGLQRLWVSWVVRSIHDAVLEDLLDNAQRAVGAPPARPARWSPWVRLLRLGAGMGASRPSTRVREVPVPPELVAVGGIDADFTDAFAVPLPVGAGRDVAGWYDALVAASTPGWLAGLIRVRGVLARALRLDTAEWEPGTSPFVLLQQTPELVVAGADDRHLDFRAVLRVQERPDGVAELVLVTLVRRHNLAGRAYFALVRPFHRRVVPSMLRGAVRRGVADRALAPTAGAGH